MTDGQLAPFIGAEIEILLTDGRRLRGRFCSVEAQLQGVGQYAIAFRARNDPIMNPETYLGLRFAEHVQACLASARLSEAAYDACLIR